MRQITGLSSSSPISIYTVDNVIPLSVIDDTTELFKLSDTNSLDLSCISNTPAAVTNAGKGQLHDWLILQ